MSRRPRPTARPEKNRTSLPPQQADFLYYPDKLPHKIKFPLALGRGFLYNNRLKKRNLFERIVVIMGTTALIQPPKRNGKVFPKA